MTSEPPPRADRPRRQVSAIPPMRRTAPGAVPPRPLRPPANPLSPPAKPPNPPATDPVPQQRTGAGRRRAPRRSARGWWFALPVALAATLIGTWQLNGSPGATPSAASDRSSSAAPTPTPTPTPSPTPPPLAPLRFRPVTTITTRTEGFFAWALMDRRTGEIWGSKTMTGVTWPASMIKAWLAADFLRRAEESKTTPSTSRMQELERMIRDSDNNAAEDIYRRNGGNASIKRLISRCKLTDTTASTAGWSFTRISARDTVRMADCIGDGTAGGQKWTGWLLDLMKQVRGEGDFGIRKALPPDEAAQVSIKNGWLHYDDDNNWHINCMALTDDWAMAVLQRYPGHGQWNTDYTRGRNVCRDVAKELLNPDYVPAG